MKIGCFASTDQIGTVEKLGFDSVELDLGEIVRMSNAEFCELEKRVADSALGFEVFSGLLPLSVRFHSQSFDEEYWMNYVSSAAARAAALGARMIPFGAGKCRSIPENCDNVEKAKRYVTHLVRRISDIVGQYGMILAVEPLGPANSNYINTIPEAADFIKEVNRSNCYTMCDMRHMHKMREPFDDISKYSDIIVHAHIDYPHGTERLFPCASDGYDYAPYFHALKEAGYQGILTIEATSYRDFASDAGTAEKYLRSLEAAE